MATLWITEYQTLAPIDHGVFAQCGHENGATVKQPKLTYTASAASAAFDANTRFVRVVADATAHLAFGAAPTADVNDTPIQAGVPEYFGVLGTNKVAAYDGST